MSHSKPIPKTLAQTKGNKPKAIVPINIYEHLPKEYRDETPTYTNFAWVRMKIPAHYILISQTGGGKTITMMNILRAINGFTHIFVVAKHPDEPLYRWLTDALNKVSKKFKKQLIHVTDSPLKLPPLDSLDASESHCCIFDDQIKCSKKEMNIIEDWFCRARHKSCSLFMCSQDYHSLPEFIRRNASGGVIIKKLQDKQDLKRIIAHYNLNTDPTSLDNFYQDCTRNIEDFMLITDGSFRKNFG